MRTRVAQQAMQHNVPLAPLTWMRAGGAAEHLLVPASVQALVQALTEWPADQPLTVIGVGSNLLVRDGGVPGLVVRLGSAFGRIEVEPGARLRAGASALAARCATAAANAGIGGLEFMRGIPGTVGGMLAMNAGCYGTEIADVFETARAFGRGGDQQELGPQEMGFGYRHCAAAADRVMVEAVFRGAAEEPAAIHARMAQLMARREAAQPVRSRTGGSTFRNPSRSSAGVNGCAGGVSAWQLIEAAGCRGLGRGDARVSTQHANFLINCGAATAADLEGLGEEVRRRVQAASGIRLEWEIRRIGQPLPEPADG